VQPGEVATIEADRELAVVGWGQKSGAGGAAGTADFSGGRQDNQSGGAMDPE
jgi:hypothetical protein